MPCMIIEPTPEVKEQFRKAVYALPQEVFDNIDRVLEEVYGDKVKNIIEDECDFEK